ncbi:MAG: ABC transporter substrate-binding protein [Alphaproteobacteria bacterium]|jgi:ABC-type branched-subunit amino acid transport system substrate-binding protein|nr:ABC transporter substrate-binding protein [Alphaproteobacteria bacterium]
MTKSVLGGRLRRRRLIGTGAALGALTVAAPYRLRAQAGLPTFTLGQIAPFTGSAAEFGEFYRDAVRLAFEQVNAAAEEVLGGPIMDQHIAEDTNTLPTPAIESTRKLVEADGVPAIVGGWSSGVSVATAVSVSIPSGVLQVANGSTSPLITVLPEDRDADLLFRTTAPDTYQGIVLAQLLSGEIMADHQFRSAATLYVNNPYGQGLSNAFARAFQARGGTVQAQVPHPEEVQPTYSSQLALALQEEPDILVCVSYPGHTATYLKEARDVFGFTSWAFCDANRSERVIEALGPDVLAGSLGTAPGQDPSIPAFQNFEATYTERFGRDRIPPFTESAYDAGIAIGLAGVKAAIDGESEITGTVLRDRLRTVANPPGEQIVGGTQEAITRAVQVLRDGGDIDYSGAAGACDFDDAGDVVTPQAIWRFTEDGAMETVQVISPEDIPSE